jgi:MFS family permease
LGFGVAILSPYINLYFHEKFLVSDRTLGFIFSMKSLITGLGLMFVPKLERIFRNRIKVVVFSQLLGGISLLLLGFSPGLLLVIIGFLLSGIFLILPIPVMNAYSMEQVEETQQATLSSVQELSWQASWGIGPFISGILQDRRGFSPVFLLSFGATCFSAVMHDYFFRKSDQQLFVKTVHQE